MDGKKKKRRKALHIGVLILGAYMLFLGGGTLLVNLTALSLGDREWVVISRVLFGAVLTAGGVWAVWDAVRDLLPSKKQEEPKPMQFIFTDTTGAHSSNVTPERLNEQLSLVAEKGAHIALQLVAPVPVAELGDLMNITYVPMEDGLFLVAVFRSEGKTPLVRRRSAEAGDAEAVMLALLGGQIPDVSAWEPVQAAFHQPETQWKRWLVLFRGSSRNEHEFFTERDLDLAVTGLSDGTYQKVLVQHGPASIEAVPGTDGDIHLRLRLQTPNGPRAYQRTGMPNQARFWLLQFYDGSMFQSSSEGWEAIDP